MKKFLHFFVKYKIWLLAFLKPLGFWGIGCIAFVDAAALPVPMDFILAGYAWEDKKHFYLYVIMAAVGSALGGLVPFLLGRAGGEIFLLKRINRERYEELRDRFAKQEFLALMIPSFLPPPTPWKLFVFAAGVFEMKISTFLLAVMSGRILRDLIVAVLTIKYGPQIISIASELATQHRFALLTGLAVLLGALGYWVWHTFTRHGKAKESA